MSRKHKIRRKPTFVGMVQAASQHTIDLRNERCVVVKRMLTGTDTTTSKRVETSNPDAIQAVSLATGLDIGAVRNSGVEGSYSSGRDTFTVRMESVDGEKATTRAQDFLKGMSRKFPGLRFNELDSRPERKGILHTFAGPLPIVHAAGSGSCWFAVLGSVPQAALEIFAQAYRDGLIVDGNEAFVCASTGTNAHMPKPFELRSKERGLRRREHAVRVEAAQKRDGKFLPTSGHANDTLDDSFVGKKSPGKVSATQGESLKSAREESAALPGCGRDIQTNGTIASVQAQANPIQERATIELRGRSWDHSVTLS